MAIRTIMKNGKRVYEVYVNGSDARGRRVQKKRCNIPTLFKAERIEFELMRELANLKDAKPTYTWGEWHKLCIERMQLNHRPSTVQNYEGRLKKWVHPYWKDTLIQEINRKQVYDLVFEKVPNTVSIYSRRNILKMIRRIFEMAVEEGVLDRNPCAGITIKVPEVDQKVLTNAEVQIFLREAKLTNHRFYPIWAMALMTGMRSGELFALKWTDIDFESRTISVSKQWSSKYGLGPTKTQRTRVVPISGDLMKFLTERKLHGGAREFVLDHLREWQNGEQAKVTRGFCAAIGITPVKFHDLRATFITNLLARGESLARVMSIVGHSQIKTTNGYLRKAGVEVQGTTERLGYSLPDESLAENVVPLFGKK